MKNVDLISISPGRHRIFSPFARDIVLTSRGLLELGAWIEKHKAMLEEETKDEVTQKLPATWENTITAEQAPIILDEYCWDGNHPGGWCCIVCYREQQKEVQPQNK